MREIEDLIFDPMDVGRHLQKRVSFHCQFNGQVEMPEGKHRKARCQRKRKSRKRR